MYSRLYVLTPTLRQLYPLHFARLPWNTRRVPARPDGRQVATGMLDQCLHGNRGSIAPIFRKHSTLSSGDTFSRYEKIFVVTTLITEQLLRETFFITHRCLLLQYIYKSLLSMRLTNLVISFRHWLLHPCSTHGNIHSQVSFWAIQSADSI